MTKSSISPETDFITDEDWATIVSNVPIPAVDLIVLHQGGVLLGKRKNEPAKGEWFVPGGRIQKGETLSDAVPRVAEKEIEVEVEILKRLGTTEHLYEESDVPGANGKHYVVTAFVVEIRGATPSHDAQHEEFRVFRRVPEDPHPYTEQYIRQVL